MNNLSKRIKQLREQRGFSKSVLAENSDLSVAYISKLESGKNYKSISLDTSQRLANGFGLSLKNFLEKVDVLKTQEIPSVNMINQAFLENGYTGSQVENIMKYADFIRSGAEKKI